MRRKRWEEQGEEVRGVELIMPLTVVLLRRDPKVRVGFGGHRVGSRNMHAARGVLAVERHLPSSGGGERETERVLAERREDGAEEGCRTSRGDDVSSKPTAAAAAGWRRP